MLPDQIDMLDDYESQRLAEWVDREMMKQEILSESKKKMEVA